jgi:hypothetical protein
VIDKLTNTTAIRTGDKVKLLPDDIAQSVATETVQAPYEKATNTIKHS